MTLSTAALASLFGLELRAESQGWDDAPTVWTLTSGSADPSGCVEPTLVDRSLWPAGRANPADDLAHAARLAFHSAGSGVPPGSATPVGVAACFEGWDVEHEEFRPLDELGQLIGKRTLYSHPQRREVRMVVAGLTGGRAIGIKRSRGGEPVEIAEVGGDVAAALTRLAAAFAQGRWPRART